MEILNHYILDIKEQKYILLAITLSISFFSYVLMRYVVLKAISRIFEKTSTKLDDILIELRDYLLSSRLLPQSQ